MRILTLLCICLSCSMLAYAQIKHPGCKINWKKAEKALKHHR